MESKNAPEIALELTLKAIDCGALSFSNSAPLDSNNAVKISEFYNQVKNAIMNKL